jgi:hypothetical protein
MRTRCFLLVELVWMSAAAQSLVDNSGRLAGMLYSGETTEIRTNLVLPTPGWQTTYSLATSTGATVSRGSDISTWTGQIALDPARRIDFTQSVREAGGKTILTLDYSAAGNLVTEGLYFRIDLPWLDFVSGKVQYDNPAQSATLPAQAPPNPNLLGGNTAGITAAAATQMLNWSARFDRPFFVNLQDKSNESPKAFTFWIYLLRGPLIPDGTSASVQVELSASGVPDTTPARLWLDPAPRFRFYGFGGNYSFQTDSPAAQYTLDNLAVHFARVEMSLDDWQPVDDYNSPPVTDWSKYEQRDRPGTRLHSQLVMARQLQQRGIPLVISVWRLPEWLYVDRGQRNPGDGRRKVDPALWDKLVAAIGTYLIWARDRYGAEPDLFSFNEANIGVNVLFSPDEHRDAIKSIGAYLESLGLKTRMLLGDVHEPRDTLDFVASAAADPEAMRLVGALSFHSWGGAPPAQYAAWGDLAENLGVPLLVAELGTDAAAWRGRAFDSFWYGLDEVRMYQELLLYARPQAAMYWEFTADYSLLDSQLQPTTRFWFTKHFTDLTPPQSDALTTASDQPKVLFTAFRKEGQYTLHIANFGAAREVRVDPLPAGIAALRGIRTTENESFAEFTADPPSDGTLVLALPERSLVTVIVEFNP